MIEPLPKQIAEQLSYLPNIYTPYDLAPLYKLADVQLKDGRTIPVMFFAKSTVKKLNTKPPLYFRGLDGLFSEKDTIERMSLSASKCVSASPSIHLVPEKFHAEIKRQPVPRWCEDIEFTLLCKDGDKYSTSVRQSDRHFCVKLPDGRNANEITKILPRKNCGKKLQPISPSRCIYDDS